MKTAFSADHIEYHFWLTFSHDGGMKMTRQEPGGLGRGMRAMKCSARLPRSLFKTPLLRAVITVGDGEPQDIELNVEAAQEALRVALGVDVDLRVEHDDD